MNVTESEQNEHNTGVCTRCGRASLAADLKVSDETMKEYLRCSLGGRVFSKTISVHGMFDLVFEALPADLEIALERYVQQHTPEISGVDLRTLVTLARIDKYDQDTGETTTVYEKDINTRREFIKHPEKSFEELAKKLDSAMLGVVRRAGLSFLVLCGAIIEELVDGDFYEGVGLL